ncbi:MAG: hypothetical protein ABSE90_12190, partial [Verrucomicrobiota bacterium]
MIEIKSSAGATLSFQRWGERPREPTIVAQLRLVSSLAPPNMPLLTELGNVLGMRGYKDVAPDGAGNRAGCAGTPGGQGDFSRQNIWWAQSLNHNFYENASLLHPWRFGSY